MLMGASCALGTFAPAASAETPARVVVAVLPPGTTPERLATVPGMSLGLMSAGIGGVPANQTYLDMSQGNRLDPTLYSSSRPRVGVLKAPGIVRVPLGNWLTVRARAASAPADLVPGLLGTSLLRAGSASRATGSAGDAGLIALRENGTAGNASRRCAAGGCSGLTVVRASVARVRALAARLRGPDLLIAFSTPPPQRDRELSIGIAGAGYHGQLTSESTHTDGLVVSTDIAPTILDRLGVPIPSAMDGQPMTASGTADAGALTSLENRLAAVPPRRAPTIGVSLVVWAALAGLTGVAFGLRGLRRSLPLLAASVAFLPALLLLTAALEPSATAERLIVGLGGPLLAVFAVGLAGPWGGLAIASLATVGGCAIVVVTGSNLTALSLIGPNPALGARFYGIGNELEAVITALVPLGVGAALTAWGVGAARGRAAAAFAAAAAIAIIAFAPGRFGADVGAAVDLSVGAAVAVAVCLGEQRRGRTVALVVAAPGAAFALLALIDLVTGGNSHLTRSVLDAGGLHDLGQVAQRRLELSGGNFSKYAGSPVLWAAVALVVAGIVRRRVVLGWFAGRPSARAGFLGAVAAVAAAILVNDSGGLLLMIGTAFLSLAAGVAWVTSPVGARRASVT
jgi:hypothetical protein